jgi:5-methylcytosine-specific restriction endonuclease McrA
MLALDVSAYLNEHPQTLIQGAVVVVFAWAIGEGMKSRRRRHRRLPTRHRRQIQRRPRITRNRPGVPFALKRRIYLRDGGRCHYCKRAVHYRFQCRSGTCDDDYEADHYWPVALGGLTTLANLVCACRSCNRWKSDKHPDVFWAEIEAVRNR